jgi:diguanylate cyclase (GGDEF)-like protein
MRLRRFSDIPLIFKVGLPPAFAVVMLTAVAAATVWSQARQISAVSGLINLNALQNGVAVDAQRITSANNALYQALVLRAAGGPAAASHGDLAVALNEIDTAKASLRKLQPWLLPGQRQDIDVVLNSLTAYRNAVVIVDSMLSEDFKKAAAFMAPFNASYARMTAKLDDDSRQMSLAQFQMAQASAYESRSIAMLTLDFVIFTLLATAAVAGVIVLSVRRTVTNISQATEQLARGQNDLDLAQLRRGDEFGAIVRSLTIFRENQFKIIALRADREALAAQQEAERIGQERIVRMITVLSEANEAILQAETPGKLFTLVCEAAALGGKFTIATALLLEPESGGLTVAASAGERSTLPYDGIAIAQANQDHDSNLVTKAIRKKTHVVCNDFLCQCPDSPFYALIEASGSKSCAALPLCSGGEVVGCFLFWSAQTGTFTPEFVAILHRLANNVSFALDNFAHAAEREKAQEKIRYLATHDSLTKLLNRTAFSQLLSYSIKNAQRYERKCAILFIDLDRFKLINDSLGHAAGDALLIEMADRLRHAVRASDVVARLGGDEFIIMLNDISSRKQAQAVAQHLLATFGTPLELSGQECRITASIGIAFYPEDGGDEQTLMKNADIAMYAAKAEGKNDVRLFSHGLKTQPIDQLKIESGLRHAIARDEFTLHYQPKLDVATGRIAGVEALLRWTHPELGLLPPMQFIPLAEETGMIVPIGKWVLNTACAQNMAWQRAGYPPVSMAVNVSPRQFSDEHLLQDIDDALAASGMAPKYLQIEITESMVMVNVERTIRILDAIQSRGVRLAIDDFGTGYSSMSMLKRFPIDTIKIDRSFVRDLPSNSEDKAIARAIIGMGKALGLTIVAEGVETLEQDAFLREHDCDEIQGYLFSRPMAADNIAELLRITKARLAASPPENFTSTFKVPERATA